MSLTSGIDGRDLARYRRRGDGHGVGDIVGDEYDAEPRVFATESVIRSYVDVETEPGIPCFWVLTADGDIYPEQVGVPGTTRMTDTGALIRGSVMVGRRPRRVSFGGGSISALTLEVVAAAMAATERELSPGTG